LTAKILVYNPAFGKGFVRSARSAFRTAGRVQRHPDYLLYATSVLEEAGHECKFVDGAVLELSLSSFEALVARFKPDMVVLHTTTPSIYNDVHYAELAKENADCLTVLVGTHASALPEQTLSKSVDVVARKEIDYTLLELAEAALGKRNIKNVSGITYYNGVEIRSTPDRPFIENLDDMPFPAWHHVDPHWYFDPVKKYPFLTCISGRGCPYQCSFCILPQVLQGRKYRLRSANVVVNEVEHDLATFPYLRGIMFEDDTLLVNRKRCRDICTEILRRKLDIWWGCNVRADVADQSLLKHMHKAGCRLFVVGYESGCQHILNNIHKGINIQVAKKFTKLAKNAGINVHGCFIVGLPGETHETVRQTLRYISELALDTIQIYAATPYPGTEFFEWAEKMGVITVKDWSKYVGEDSEQTCIISYPNLDGAEILNYVNIAYKNFYFSPNNAVKLLLKIRGLNDLRQFARGFSNFFNYWVSYGRKNLG
jgi:radical SAM superfamily enzyme YgiQ (UPF0313 family)